MKVASVTALAASLFFTSAYAGAQGPVNNVPGPASTSGESFQTVPTALTNGKVLTYSKLNGNKIYPRLEIRNLKATQPDQYNIFLLALAQWQAEANIDLTSSSYYGVASIHGLPYQPFNGVGCPICPDGTFDCCPPMGYCPHDTVLFPSWHRTYVATYEQQLLARAWSIAQNWGGPRKAEMQTAAAQLRLPYWDWAIPPATNDQVVPDAITALTVSVTLSNGQQVSNFPNPLASFLYPDSSYDKMKWEPWTKWTTTLRYPTSDASDAQTQVQPMLDVFQNGFRANLQDSVYHLLTACQNYTLFASDGAFRFTDNACANSLESIHNTVHVNTGGSAYMNAQNVLIQGGHMTYLPLAAYDPLFWIHHANVDRVFAMWQSINPTQYGGSLPANDSTYTIKKWEMLNENSDLTPFYKDDTTFWNTKDVRDWSNTFGYTYPEYTTSNGDAAAYITKVVNTLYGSKAAPGVQLKDVAKRSIGSYAPAGKAAGPALIDNAKLAPNGSEYQYWANIQTPRYALGTTYNVFIFFGEPAAEDPSSWMTDANLVGPFGVMADAPGSSMQMENVIISGAVPLTRTLHAKLEAGIIASMAPADVNAYLKANLIWKIAASGSCVEPASLEGFSVSVATTTATRPTDLSELPVYSSFNLAIEVTAGVAGGLNATTELLGNVASDLQDCVVDVLGSVAEGDVGGVVSGVVSGVKDTLGSLTSGLSNIGKSLTAPITGAAAKAPTSGASSY